MEKKPRWPFFSLGRKAPISGKRGFDALDKFQVRVERCWAAADRVRAFDLVALGKDRLPPFAAGAHIEIEIDKDCSRQYSLCNPPSETHRYRIAVLREAHSRGGSAFMHDVVKVGDLLTISQPRNHFALADRLSGVRLIAGGIGITPLLAMAAHLHDAGVPFQLHYLARSWAGVIFADEIAASGFGHCVAFHISDQAEHRFDLALALASPQPGEHLYVCGPASLIEDALRLGSESGWPPEALHREHFMNDRSGLTMHAFTVRLAKSGRRFLVPADKSVLQVLREAGIEIESSCEEGTCGTCVTRVLAGEVDHRDVYLTQAERVGAFTPCCSRAHSEELVLDL